VKRRVLVVGCGYVGLPLARALAGAGHDVFGLRRSAAARDEFAASGITLLTADITQPASLSALPTGFDWVIHCVASSGGSLEDYRQVYFEGTRNLLHWLSAKPPEKFVYTSSTSVYGQTDGASVDETSVAAPDAETAQVLVATERLLIRPAGESPVGALILRLAGIYGPGRGHWFKQFLRGEARIEGSGERWLNMIHRDDVVGAIAAALDCGTPGRIYNVVDDEPVRQRDFFAWLASQLGRPLPPEVPENSGTVRRRGLTHKRVVNRRLRAELQYALKFPTFREGYASEIQRVIGSPA